MSLYYGAKWRTARLTRFHYRSIMLFAIGLALLSSYLTQAPTMRYLTYAQQRGLEVAILLIACAAVGPVMWSRFHLGSNRHSLQLYVEDLEQVSLHWTPYPEWIRRLRRRERGDAASKLSLSIPRREALWQLQRWVVDAHLHRYRRVRLDSPLFLTRSPEGDVVVRRKLWRFAEQVGKMPEVARVDIMPPQRLALGRAAAFRFFWPKAARDLCRTPDGSILVVGMVIHLADVKAPGPTGPHGLNRDRKGG